MKTQSNTFGVIFYLRKYKATTDGKVPIYVRITVNGHRTDLSVKRSIDPANWNASRGMAKGSKQEVTNLNNYLEQYRSGIVESYQELFLQQKLITATLVKNRFTGQDKVEYTLCKLIEFHNADQSKVLEVGTMKNYYTTQKYIKEFLNIHFKTTDKYLSELNYQFIIEFEHYLRNRRPEVRQRELGNNGVMKHLERLCKMVNLAVKLDWLPKNPFQAYQLKFQKTERPCLTPKELKRIEKKEFSIARLSIVKDLFIFSCYTGLAYIDVCQLTPDNVVEKENGSFWLVTRRQKTDTSVKIPLLPQALAIIERYNGDPQVLAEGKLLPTLSHQKLNSYLKEIADVCGIKQVLTFHVARHTFATTITLSNGVPIESVSKLLGHTKISTTQIYARVVETKLSKDMKRLKKRLEVQPE
jgi:integrase